MVWITRSSSPIRGGLCGQKRIDVQKYRPTKCEAKCWGYRVAN